jgi:hypothetical protein
VTLRIAQQKSAILLSLVIVIAAGILSRRVHTGSWLIDKYLGDALYAAMFYLLIRLFFDRGTRWQKALVAFGLVVLIECFQLTYVPLRLSQSSDPVLRIIAVLLGTKFSPIDILAYLAGVAGIYVLDRRVIAGKGPNGTLGHSV